MSAETRELRSVTFSLEALTDLIRTAVEAGATDAELENAGPEERSRPVARVAEEVWREWLSSGSTAALIGKHDVRLSVREA